MFNPADILYSNSRKSYLVVVSKDLCENGVYRYTVWNLTQGKYMNTFLPRGLYKKRG